MWVMASPKSARMNLDWLAAQGIVVPEEMIYMAPLYGAVMEDAALLERVDRLRPQHIVVTVGGWDAGAAGAVCETARGLQAGNPLHWSGNCVFEWRPGEHPGVCRQVLPGVAVSEYLGAEAVFATVLGGAETGGADVEVWQ